MGARSTRLIRLEPCGTTAEGGRRLAAALDEPDARRGRDLAGASFLRIEQPLAAGDALAWLGRFPGLGRLYWSSRDGSFEIAAAGTAAAADGASPAVLTALLEEVASGDTAEVVRLIGTLRFDLDRPADAEWAAFKRAQFVLPLLELRRTGDALVLAVNLRVGDGMQTGWFDAQRRTARKTLEHGAALLRAADAAAPQGEDDDPSAWSGRVAAILAQIAGHDVEKVVLARRRSHVHATEPLDVLRALRAVQPRAYHFLVQPPGGGAFVGASPERLYRRRGRELDTEALAGTCPRGPDRASDEQRIEELAASPKDLVEHAIVRRHVLEQLAALVEGVEAAPAPAVSTLAELHHLHTPIAGRLRPGVGDAALLAALHPTPAVCGTPTEAARRFLRGSEPFDRGLYAGPIGCFGRDTAEVAVALRCALMRGHWVQLFAGAGIVGGSDAHAEWQETSDKMRTLEQVLGADDAP